MDYQNIINRNVVRIISVLRNERLYLNQIHEKSKIKSKNNLLRNLDRLVEANVLMRDKGKGNTYFELNYDNEVCKGFLELIDSIKLQSLPLERRRAVIEFFEEIDCEICVVFGSSAKGGFVKESDLDLLIVCEKTEGMDELKKKIGSKYGVKLNVNVVSMEEFESKNEGIIHIIKTGFPVFGKRKFYRRFRDV